MSESARPLAERLGSALPGIVSTRLIDRVAIAPDASHFQLTPQVVVRPRDVTQVARLMQLCSGEHASLTFRSGGTSLSGQAVTSGVIADTRRHFQQVKVLEEGRLVRAQPGTTVARVNAALRRYGRMLGPDPASEVACTIGGVVANNSSGMACGTHANAYRTLVSIVLVLPSGTVLDTSQPNADEKLRIAEPALYSGLIALRDRIRDNAASLDTIAAQYAIKNTMGYGLNSFVDFDSPSEILAHLAVGSEGTLGFVAEVTFRTVPLASRFATGLLIFPTLRAAASAIQQLVDAGFATIELLDAASLRIAQTQGRHAELETLVIDEHTALLVELRGADDADISRQRTAADLIVADLTLACPAALTTDAGERSRLWHLRKDLYPLIAGTRPSGTTALLEDVAVPVSALARLVAGLTALFARHGYDDAVIFGHARDGNLHFMITVPFGDPEGLARYESFTEDLVDLVLGLGGTLKAEHGTGRVMAPFVRRQFGDELYDVMRSVKQIVDPAGVLNPHGMMSIDPGIHLADLKTTVAIEEEADRCVECGYCEAVCPSRSLTLTPRQRIVVRREFTRAAAAGDSDRSAELDRAFEYDGEQTCAVDGMCQTACPVGIDTGALVKRLRSSRNSRVTAAAWSAAADLWGPISRAGGVGLTVARTVSPLAAAATVVGRGILGSDTVPRWSAELPGGGRPRRSSPVPDPDFVFFPACVGTMFGPAGSGPGVGGALVALSERAGLRVSIPQGIEGMCCSTPWASKGFTDGAHKMRERVTDLLTTSVGGRSIPIVVDASSCTEGLRAALEATDSVFEVVDAVDFALREILPRLREPDRLGTIAVHPTCSTVRAGETETLRRLAANLADIVLISDDWGCCAFAGDRGLLHPELTASATAPEAADLSGRHADAYVSSNRTCELGMTRAMGVAFEHILEVLERATR